MHLAAGSDHFGTLGLLLNKGGQIEAIDKDHNTPMHLAAQGGHTSVVELLFLQGALTAVRNKYGQTPYHLANNHRTICKRISGIL